MVETCQAVLASVNQLQQAVTSLQVDRAQKWNLQSLHQGSMAAQAERLERAVEARGEGGEGRRAGGELGELRQEIQSVKGLLLSRWDPARNRARAGIATSRGHLRPSVELGPVWNMVMYNL